LTLYSHPFRKFLCGMFVYKLTSYIYIYIYIYIYEGWKQHYVIIIVNTRNYRPKILSSTIAIVKYKRLYLKLWSSTYLNISRFYIIYDILHLSFKMLYHLNAKKKKIVANLNAKKLYCIPIVSLYWLYYPSAFTQICPNSRVVNLYI